MRKTNGLKNITQTDARKLGEIVRHLFPAKEARHEEKAIEEARWESKQGTRGGYITIQTTGVVPQGSVLGLLLWNTM